MNVTGSQDAIESTRQWVNRAVIGLNLCPFAKSVEVKGQVRYVVSDAVRWDDILLDLENELRGLDTAPPNERDTTLLILRSGLTDFVEFNAFLHEADRLIAKLDMQGVYQIASLHPRYQFADTEADDITNYTNRSPYPTLHLLREASIDRAVAAFPDAAAIFETNMETMRRIGLTGWHALGIRE
jgi:uncharacterized protein